MFYNLEPGQTAHGTSLFNILASIKTFVENSNMFVFILIFSHIRKTKHLCKQYRPISDRRSVTRAFVTLLHVLVSTIQNEKKIN